MNERQIPEQKSFEQVAENILKKKTDHTVYISRINEPNNEILSHAIFSIYRFFPPPFLSIYIYL